VVGADPGFFAAPWGARLRTLTPLGSALLIGESLLMLGLSRVVPYFGPLFLGMSAAMLCAVSWCGLSVIRGYRVEAGRLVVERTLFSSEYPLAGLRSVAHDPSALRFTPLGFGNGGLFVISDRRFVAPYGWCRSLATDPANAVVLCWDDRRLIVTPDRPAEFVARIEQSRT
jgi:hypothetical protein